MSVPTSVDPVAERIRAGIAGLLRGDRGPAPRESSGESVDPRSLALDVEGAKRENIAGHRVWVIRRSLEDLLPGSDLVQELTRGLSGLARREPSGIYPGLRPALGHRPEDIAILDLETTGFWGCPIFLVGMLLFEAGRFESVQILARDYPDERPMLAAAAALLHKRELLVTFNGKSYDVPCLRERCSLYRIRNSVHRLDHVDVLHVARRRWKDELPDCRLQTLEWEVVGLRRTGDVPSSQIPDVYHDFAASGDVEALRPVLHHGRVDVLTTARLFARLASDPPAPVPRKKRKGSDAGSGSSSEPT